MAVSKYIEELVERKDEFYQALIDNYGDVLQSCVSMGITYTDFKKMMSDSSFSMGLDQVKEILLNKVESATFRSAINGNTKSQQFILKNKMREEYGSVARSESIEFDGPPVINFHIPDETRAMLEAGENIEEVYGEE
jgi:hypothetical protein